MSILNIVKYPDPILRKECELITKVDDKIRKLAASMAETMYEAPGVGLAAPQVGENIQLIVLDPNAGDEEQPSELYTLINPRIVKHEGKVESEEGCLSIVGIKETINRFEKVVVEAITLDEKEIKIDAEDFLAIILQHEIDHLNGILFIDYLSRLKQTIVKSKIKKNNAEDC